MLTQFRSGGTRSGNMPCSEMKRLLAAVGGLTKLPLLIVVSLFLSGCKKNGEDPKAEEDKAKENDFPKPKPNNRKTVFQVKTQKQPQATLKANQPLPNIH